MHVTILPEKHVRTSESLLGLGALILDSLSLNPKTLDELWADMKNMAPVKGRIHGSVTLDTIVLAIDFLFTVGAVSLTSDGLLENAAR